MESALPAQGSVPASTATRIVIPVPDERKPKEPRPNSPAFSALSSTTVTPTMTLVIEASPVAGVVLTDVPDLQVIGNQVAAERVVGDAPPEAAPPEESVSGKWIEVDLSRQRLYAHEGQETVLAAEVSTGTRYYPTLTGRFDIYAKYRSTPMSGPGYYLPGVPWTMYFYQGYAIHGAYWHNSFGQPMSHSCVNMRVNQAKWLYAWAPKGTQVVVHR